MMMNFSSLALQRPRYQKLLREHALAQEDRAHAPLVPTSEKKKTAAGKEEDE